MAIMRGIAVCLFVWAVTVSLIYFAATHPRLDSLWVLGTIVLGGYLAATAAVVDSASVTGEQK